MVFNKYLFMLGIVIAFVIAGVLLSMNPRKVLPASESPSPQTQSAAKLVNPQEFAQIAQQPNAFILDVHTPEQTHIPGTDAVIPFDQILANQEKLPEDKSTPILVYCRSGGMSQSAVNELVGLGYTTVYDLAGGANAYREQHVSVSLWPEKQPLGQVVYGQVASTEFTLTNFSPLPLKINRVSTSCGCTKAKVAKETLGGYESTVVTVSFDPAVHTDDTDLGEITRTIYIETDHPDYPNLEAIITATVTKES